MTLLLAMLAVLFLLGFGLRLYLSRAAEGRLRADEVVDFKARGSAGRDNVFAACPPGYCTPAADAPSPVFAMPWERLRDYWQEMIAAEPNTMLVEENAERRRLTYIQRTVWLHFPDIVTVEFVPLGEGSASLAIDSRSRYGKGDLGANRRRVTRWLERLQAMSRGAVAG